MTKLWYLVTRRTPWFQCFSMVPATVQLAVLAVEVYKVHQQLHADTTCEASWMPDWAWLSTWSIHRQVTGMHCSITLHSQDKQYNQCDHKAHTIKTTLLRLYQHYWDFSSIIPNCPTSSLFWLRITDFTENIQLITVIKQNVLCLLHNLTPGVCSHFLRQNMKCNLVTVTSFSPAGRLFYIELMPITRKCTDRCHSLRNTWEEIVSIAQVFYHKDSFLLDNGHSVWKVTFLTAH